MSSSITVTPLTGFDRNKSKTFESSSVTVGTDAGNDIKFDPTWEKTVSGLHARVVMEAGGCWVIDASSRDGTLVDGEKVQRHQISSGAVIELGSGGPKIKIEFVGQPEPTSSPNTVPAAQAASPAPIAPSAPGPSAPQPIANNVAGKMVAISIAVILVAAGAWWLLHDSFGDPEDRLARVAEDKVSAVGVIALTGDDGKLVGNGTAWAVAPRVWVTNTAQVLMVELLMAEGSPCFIVVKTEEGSQRLRISGSRLHPDGDFSASLGEDQHPLVMPHDASLLITELDGPDWFELASEADLEGLAASDPVGTMAFTRTTSLESPRARTAFGRIVQLSDPRLEPIDSDDPVVIRHRLFVMPDMSGGPIFQPDGKVVGILTIPMVSELDPDAAGSASGKYGLRIDVLRSVWADYPLD